MSATVDPVLLIAGLARVVVWATIAVIGYRQRRAIPLAFGALAATTSVVFAISNAHGHVPGVVTDASAFVALPIVMLILMGVVVTRPTLRAPRGRGWHL